MDKRVIVVTGGAGHVGSHVVEMLVKDPQNRVISLDNYFNGRHQNHIEGAEYREGHTKDIDTLIPEQPDIVYHLGEYARVAPSFKNPEVVFDLNIMGTFAVVEFCRKRNVKLVYAASSTKFAAEGNGRHQNPYSFTKAVNVDLINNYGAWYGLTYAICYFYNAFGPREKADGDFGTLISKFEQAYLRGEPLTVVCPGTQKRNFTYVKDLARGIIMVGEKGDGDGYALNNKNEYSILDIAKAFGAPIRFVDGYPGRDKSGDSPERAHEELGWHATVEIMDYIKDFVSKNPRPEYANATEEYSLERPCEDSEPTKESAS